MKILPAFSIFLLLFSLITFTPESPLSKTSAYPVEDIVFLDLVNKEHTEEINQLLDDLKTGFLTADTDIIERLFLQKPILQASGETPFGVFPADSKSPLSDFSYESFIDRVENGGWQAIEMHNIEVKQHPSHSESAGIQLEASFHTENKVYDGYVFLLTDKNEEDNSYIILMKTWQQQEVTNEDEQFGLDDLEIM